MAKRKKTYLKTDTAPPGGPTSSKSGPRQMSVNDVARANLELAEMVGRGLPTLNGVPVALGMTYDLVQLFNTSVINAQNPDQPV